MKEEVMAFLDQLKYTCTPEDETLIELLIEKVASDIKSVCNQAEVPEEMHQDHVFAVAGELLLIRKGSGQLDLSAISLEGVKAITEGDIKVEFASDSSDSSTQFTKLVTALTNWQEKAIRFRKLVW